MCSNALKIKGLKPTAYWLINLLVDLFLASMLSLVVSYSLANTTYVKDISKDYNRFLENTS